MSEDQSKSELTAKMTALSVSHNVAQATAGPSGLGSQVEDGAGPSGLGSQVEDGEDFSDSSSDWKPSGQDIDSSDSETETKAKKKLLERCKRKNSRSNKDSSCLDKAVVRSETIEDCMLKINALKKRVAISRMFDTEAITKLEKSKNMTMEFLRFRTMLLQSAANVGSTEQTTVKFSAMDTSIAPNLTAENELQGSCSKPANNEPEVLKKTCDKVFNINKAVIADVNHENWVPIGSGITMIPRDKYEKINWKSYTIATRTLLMAVFPRSVLATHSMTGKPSPAFRNKPAKMSLDSRKVADVIAEVVDRFKVPENIVRSIITTKCADECKMMKMRREKERLAK